MALFSSMERGFLSNCIRTVFFFHFNGVCLNVPCWCACPLTCSNGLLSSYVVVYSFPFLRFKVQDSALYFSMLPTSRSNSVLSLLFRLKKVKAFSLLQET